MKYERVRNKLCTDIKKSRVRYYTDAFVAIYFDPQKTGRIMKGLLRLTVSSVPEEIKLCEKKIKWQRSQ